MAQPQILLIEDDKTLALTIRQALEKKYQVVCAFDCEGACKQILFGSYALYIIDIFVPSSSGADGLDLCKFIRSLGILRPILFITAKAGIEYKLTAFKNGADDYLVKPFNFLELNARVDSLVKRSGIKLPQSDLLIYDDLVLDKKAYLVTRGSKHVPLRRKEFELLEYMMTNAGCVITRDMILETIWMDAEDLTSNTIDVHIKNLRTKLDSGFEKKLIKTVYGVGYKLS